MAEHKAKENMFSKLNESFFFLPQSYSILWLYNLYHTYILRATHIIIKMLFGFDGTGNKCTNEINSKTLP